MGNSPSQDNSDKKINNSKKSPPKKILKKPIPKKIKKDKVETTNNIKIPEYHLHNKSQINNGVNDYQYFKHIIPPQDIGNQFGVDTTLDNKYSKNINKLYDNEINYRTNVDCSKEKPYTRDELENELKNNDNLDKNNQSHYIHNIQTESGQINENSYSTSENTQSHEITITREDAIDIKNCRYLSDLEKRLLIMNSIRLSEIDPLGIQDEHKVRLVDLVDKYKSLLKIYHPDKTGGMSNDMFITVKEALDNQVYILNAKVMDKDYNQLKQDYQTYKQDFKKKKPIFFENDVEKFDSTKFNKFYDEHKFKDEYEDDGYGEIMIEGGIREDIEVEKLEITKNNTFQDQFNKKLSETSNEIVEYSIPKAINHFDNYSELCSKRNGYTGKSSNINCFDYKEAFEIMNIDRNQEISEVSLEEYKKNRKDDKLLLNDKQKEAIEKDSDESDKKEKKRQSNLIDYMHNIDKYNQKINKILIRN